MKKPELAEQVAGEVKATEEVERGYAKRILCKECNTELLEFWDPKLTFVTLTCPKCEEAQLKDVLKAPRRMSYDEYRQQTGICETCRQPIKTHPKCQGCGILTGKGHVYSLITYRQKKLCPGCIKQWKALERYKDKQLTWQEAGEIWYHLETGVKRGKPRVT